MIMLSNSSYLCFHFGEYIILGLFPKLSNPKSYSHIQQTLECSHAWGRLGVITQPLSAPSSSIKC